MPTRVNPLSLLLVLIVSILVAAIPASGSAPVVSNVNAHQVPGSGMVQITYDVSNPSGDSVMVYVLVTGIAGGNPIVPASATGAINCRVAPGTSKQVMWNAALDYPGQNFSAVVASVYATDVLADVGEMVFVPAGSFNMGSTDYSDAQPVHAVQLSAYYIQKYDVTTAQYQRFIDAGGYSNPAYWSAAGWSYRLGKTAPEGWGSGRNSSTDYPGFPATGVSWFEAQAYATFAGLRLPTEAEWERAARGTDGRQYPWGSTLDPARANYFNSGDPYEPGTTPVGYFNGSLYLGHFQTADSPSPCGAYDMAGNVAEWTADIYGAAYYAQSPPSNPGGPPGPPSSSSLMVVRGGSYGNYSYGGSGYGYITTLTDLSAAKRTVLEASDTYTTCIWYDCYSYRCPEVGFRCARSAQ